MCEKCDNTNGNKISLKPVGELLGKNFFVPSYQRGYRWTRQEVKDLLDDIYEFHRKEGKTPGEFYCLQPLVVRWREEKQSYEVIDGQQRLTTIFIILKYLGEILEESHKRLMWTMLEYLEGGSKTDTEKFLEETSDEYLKNVPYSLAYDTRENSKDFLENLGDKTVIIVVKVPDGGISPKIKGNLDRKPDPRPEDTADFFSMNQAYETVEGWFNDRSKDEQEDFLLKLLNDVQFIWYETDESDPIKVFTRLNIGKIPLTNAELIKALFLNSSNFRKESDKHLRLRQQEIASEWDQIEYTLQNEEFWLFIHNKGYKNPTRIDFIFDIICERESDQVNTTGIDSYRTFRHFYKSFKNAKKAMNAENDEKEAEKYIEKAKKLIEDVKGNIDWKKTYGVDEVKEVVDEVKEEIEKCDTIYRWKEVKKIFQTFNEWFNDLELYHHVGYLVDGGEEIKELYEDWTESKNKNDFVEKVKDRIWEKVMGKIEEKDKQEDMIAEKLKLIAEKLDKTYENITDCRPLLLLHNIQTVIDQCKNSTKTYGGQVFYKFPFHIYKKEKWNVEHIDSNTPNDESETDVQKEWVLPFCELPENTKELKEDIINFYNDIPNHKEFRELRRELISKFHLKDTETEISPTKNEDSRIMLNGDEKNQIMNFALLDEHTNKSYGNSIFSAKRRILIGKDRGKKIKLLSRIEGENLWDDNENAESSFVPPCTRQVFLKYYSIVSTNPNYWTLSDAKAYKKDISKTLEKLLNLESKQDG